MAGKQRFRPFNPGPKGQTPPKNLRFPDYFGKPSQMQVLSILEKRHLSSVDIETLKQTIAGMIAMIEGKCEDDAKGLRRHVHSYLTTLASSRGDELSGMGVEFKKPQAETIVLESGETDDPEAAGKIVSITEGCVSIAKDDLSFLKDALSSLKKEDSLPPEYATKLKEIIVGNSFWRFFSYK
jgi:hypothetical protein